MLDSEPPLATFAAGKFTDESINVVLGRMISEIGKSSQFDAHWLNMPFMEFEPSNNGCRPTRLLLFLSCRIVPIVCLNDPESAASPPAA